MTLAGLRKQISDVRVLGLMPPVNDPRNDVEQMLDREIHDSEGLRAVILAVVFTAAIGILGWAQWTGRREVQELLPTPAYRIAVWVSLGIALLIVVLIKPASVLLKRANHPPPLGGRLISAFLETSLPTAVIYAFTAHKDGTAIDALGLFPSFLYFPLIVLSILRFDRKLSIFTGLVAAAEYGGLSWWILSREPAQSGLVLADLLAKSGLLFVSGVLAGEVSARIRGWIGESFEMLEEKKRTLDRFGQHVSPAVAAKLLEQKELGNETRHVCIMFLDIRNFTTFSEKRSPDEVLAYLNSLFGFMIDAVNANNGIINKFLGDGFMAVFGAPLSDGHDCRNAITASRVILAGVEALVAKGAIPPTRVGIGLHTGPAVTGVVGSEARGEYAVIGDVVNLASRIESLNKEIGSCLLASDEVMAAVGAERPTDAVARGAWKVKGRESPVELFQLG